MFQPLWLQLAWADLGVAEAAGSRNNPRVIRYYAEVGHAEVADDDVAWCAAFLGACLERAGTASTRSLMARSYLNWGDAVIEPRLGAVAVLSRGFDPRLGHVGFVVGTTPDDLILLGGNQDNAVTVRAFPRTRLLGMRWPSAPSSESDAVVSAGSVRPPDPLFELALAHILEMEGGYSDDPYDPGGPTNFGITLTELARASRVKLSAATIAGLKADLKTISQTTVRRIYLERYWRPASCPELPPALALMHFDAAVNQGVAGAIRMLQQAVGATVDGEIGPLTRAALAAKPVTETLAAYADIRRARYRKLGHFWRFGKGWLRRVDSTLARAIEIAATRQPALSQQPKEPQPMAAQTPAPSTPPATESKWWGQSLTIWGVVLTTLSTVLPTVGPLFGFNITAELVNELGNQIVLLGQAIAALIGTVMTVYGRVRATTTLERRQITMNM